MTGNAATSNAQGLKVCGVGTIVGLVAALAVGRAMSSLLFGVGALDPVAYVAALGVMIAAATVATYVPARRAATIDPIETLRAERRSKLIISSSARRRGLPTHSRTRRR